MPAANDHLEARLYRPEPKRGEPAVGQTIKSEAVPVHKRQSLEEIKHPRDFPDFNPDGCEAHQVSAANEGVSIRRGLGGDQGSKHDVAAPGQLRAEFRIEGSGARII